MSFNIPITTIIYDRGLGGIPTTTFRADQQINQLLQSYEHTITAKCGFETATIPIVCDPDTAMDWLNNGLMRSIIVYGPDGEVIWGGFLETIDAQFGQETRSVSLRDMQNRVRTKYTTVFGTPGTTSSSSDTTSQGLYGIKDGVISLGTTTATAAANAATRYLRERKNPIMTPTTSVMTGDMGDVQLTLHFAGWYTAFDWLVTSSTSTSNVTTTTQVLNLTTTYNSTNNFFSTDSYVISSSISDTEYIEAETTYRQKIEALLEQGNTNGERLAWGIYEGRQWRIVEWAGATPATVNYYRDLVEGKIYDSVGGVIAPWNVRPDKMYQMTTPFDPAPVSTAQDAAARFYVERVTCRIDGDAVGVDLEPAQSSGVDATIARLSR